MLTILLMLSMAGSPEPVATIFADHCVQCHHVGGMAPFSVETYDQARPWAKSIARAVASKDMPPFGADGPIGKYRDDPRLTDAEIDAVVAWTQRPSRYEGIEHGETTYPGLRVMFASTTDTAIGRDTWFFLPATKVASATVSGFRWVVPNEIPLHHASLSSMPASALTEAFEIERGDLSDEFKGLQSMRNFLPGSAYFPGNSMAAIPSGYGVRIPAGERLVAVVHFGPQDAAKDLSGLGVDLIVDEDAELLPGPFMFNFRRLKSGFGVLAPGENQRTMTRVAEVDMVVHSVRVHMHELGKSALVTVDGVELISIPRYDFDWQLDYSFAEPVLVRAGSEMSATLTWDNDRGVPVTYGQKTKQEMGGVAVTWTPYDPATSTTASPEVPINTTRNTASAVQNAP